MGKGKALRRRAKLVQASTHGNLHKAQKGKASRELPLPSAPSSKDMVDKLPASLRKMMALKVDMGQIETMQCLAWPQTDSHGLIWPAGRRREPSVPTKAEAASNCICRSVCQQETGLSNAYTLQSITA